jgi:hypothetical protein
MRLPPIENEINFLILLAKKNNFRIFTFGENCAGTAGTVAAGALKNTTTLFSWMLMATRHRQVEVHRPEANLGLPLLYAVTYSPAY